MNDNVKEKKDKFNTSIIIDAINSNKIIGAIFISNN